MKKLLLPLFILALTGQSCLSASSTRPQGGIHVSENRGETWSTINSTVNDEGDQGSLATQQILDFDIDPENPDTMYASTQKSGLFQTENAGESWSAITQTGIIQAMDINPREPQQLVAARQNQIFFTENQGDIWKLVYTDPTEQFITDLAFHPLLTNEIYALLATGQIIKSVDSGGTWSVLYDFDQPIRDLYIERRSPANWYVISPTKGAYRSTDAGRSWTILTESFESFTNSVQIVDFAVHPQNSKLLILALSNKGLYVSEDAGDTWTQKTLLTDSKPVLSVAWHLTNRQIFYYATETVFYQTVDGGNSWRTTPLVVNRLPLILETHPDNPDQLFIGTRNE